LNCFDDAQVTNEPIALYGFTENFVKQRKGPQTGELVSLSSGALNRELYAIKDE